MSERTNLGVDPSLKGGDASVRFDVPVEVVTVFGGELVHDIESLVADLELLEEFSRAEDPFIANRPSEIALSGLAPEVRNAIVNYHLNRSLRSLKKIGDDSIARELLRPRVVTKRVFSESLGVPRAEKQAEESADILSALDDDLSNDQSTGGTEDLTSSIIKSWFEQINIAAKTLPSQATMQTLQNFGLLNIDEMAFLTREESRQLIGTPRLLKKDHKYKKKGTEGVDKVVANVREIRRWGSALYKRILGFSRKLEETAALSLIDKLSQGQRATRVAAGTTPEQLTEIENYLSEKANFAENSLKRYGAGSLADPTVRSLLSQLQSSALTQRLHSEAIDEGAEKLRLLNQKINEANDILLGGRRLKGTKKYPRPSEIANDLAKLFAKEPDTQLEQGLILAILTDKLSSFVSTIERLKSPMDEPLIPQIETGKQHIIQTLKSFDLLGHLDTLKNLNEQYKEKMTDLLSPGGYDKIQRSLNKYLENPDGETEDRTVEEILSPVIGELDWTVLPYGESGEQELENAAREIVEEAQKRADMGEKITLDLERLVILKNLREWWGTDRSHYQRGRLKDRKKIKDGSHFDEYIILVLQQLDPQGKVVTEHAVAESPIAEINALYLFRADTEISQGYNWREVFSVSKEDARDIGGARDLHHTKGDGSGVVDVLSDRVRILLNCEAKDFYAIRFKPGRHWVSRSLGNAAMNSAETN